MGLTRVFDEEDRPFLARKASLTTLKNLFFGKRLFLTLLFFGSSFANNLRLSESGRVSSITGESHDIFVWKKKTDFP